MSDIAALRQAFQGSLASDLPFDRTSVVEQLNDQDRLELARMILDDSENLNFVLSSSNSEGFTSQISGFFSKAIAEGAIAEEKSTRDASKVHEGEGEKPEVQVERLLFETDDYEGIVRGIGFAEELVPASAEIFCRGSLILFRLGMVGQIGRPAIVGRGRCLLLALDKITYAEVIDPVFFTQKSDWFHLWGNILVALYVAIGDETYLVNGLSKFEKAQAQPTIQLFWDFGRAWVLLGKGSQEIADIQKGIEKYREAARLGCTDPDFRLDYGEAIALLGSLKGEPSLLEEAAGKYQRAIAETDQPNEKPHPTFIRGWNLYTQAIQMLAEFRGDPSRAEKVFQEAILSVPSQADLWLRWGELYLRLGWARKKLSFIETGLEKLTSSKIKECDPIYTSALLGEGLTLLGLFAEDLKLLREGEERITAALDLAPENPELVFASSLSALAFGLYFSDPAYLEQAANRFHQAIAQNGTSFFLWYGLYQSYLAWGMNQKKTDLIHKGLEAISRAIELTPTSAYLWNEWGSGLMRLDRIERGHVENALKKFEQAIILEEDVEWIFNYGCALDVMGDLKAEELYYEKAIGQLSYVQSQLPRNGNVRYHLALAHSHLGELTANVENLYHAVDLFEGVVMEEQDDGMAWCEWGYAQLNLSELIYDSVQPEKSLELRAEAEKRLVKAAKLGHGPANYHLACLYSLAGIDEVAMDYLKRADTAHALPDLENIENDKWLEGLRQTPAFQEFMELRRRERYI